MARPDPARVIDAIWHLKNPTTVLGSNDWHAPHRYARQYLTDHRALARRMLQGSPCSRPACSTRPIPRRSRTSSRQSPLPDPLPARSITGKAGIADFPLWVRRPLFFHEGKHDYLFMSYALASERSWYCRCPPLGKTALPFHEGKHDHLFMSYALKSERNKISVHVRPGTQKNRSPSLPGRERTKPRPSTQMTIDGFRQQYGTRSQHPCSATPLRPCEIYHGTQASATAATKFIFHPAITQRNTHERPTQENNFMDSGINVNIEHIRLCNRQPV